MQQIRETYRETSYKIPRNTHMQTSYQLTGQPLSLELKDLYDSSCVLNKPIPIKLIVDRNDASYIFTQETLNLWGEASSLQGAERELAREIIRLYKRLSSLKVNELGPYPVEQLAYLKQFIS